MPDGSPEELLKFIQELSAYRPDVKSREEAMEHMGKQHKAIIAAADKILAGKPDEASRASAVRSKLQSSWIVANTVDRDSLPKVQELVKQLAGRQERRGGGRSKIVSAGHRFARHRARQARGSQGPGRPVRRGPGQGTAGQALAGLAINVPLMLDQAGHTELACEAARQFIEALKKSKNEELAPVIGQLEGTLRKLDIVGKPLDIEGTLVDGKKFDWSAYKGKVVLVDFWATWCGPCLGELPNVRKTYDTFHDRGFDVIGISLDEEQARSRGVSGEGRDPLADPVWRPRPRRRAGRHPMAVRYGIDGIPAAFLVNKEGKVVSTNARGEALPRLVAELLGPPPVAAEKDAGDKPADAKPASDKEAGDKDAASKEATAKP